ncbi:transporter substrate-binding domain-containing protein [Alteromonas halophila]|uniref:Solute-binding protein family 3/N-terminal domain-containing protein n=1 Tax=Alteromonas halophila TaxID=516698 RepID=A0A918JLK4_9ALTE|nr:transporter substrate-binding domain-containing protein [Alteromonas halophila]GGW85287.1 hypothetical protein GCM10007391_18990 [Alteromonas halophila]
MHSVLIAALILLVSSVVRADSYIIGAQNIQYYPHYDFGSEVDKGYAWAVLEAFAQHSGHEFIYLAMPIRRLQMELLKGNVDFVYPDNPTWYNQIVPASEKAFSQPLTRALGGTIVKADAVGRDIDAIRRLAMPLGFTPVNWQTRIDNYQTEITTVTDTPISLKLLTRNRVDAINLEYHVAQYLSATTPNVDNVTLDVQLPHSDIGFRLATIRHNDLIDELDDFLTNNQPLISEIRTRYGIQQPQQVLEQLAQQQSQTATLNSAN